MKRFFLLLLATALFLTGAYAQNDTVNIIPKPTTVVPFSGTFTLSRKTKIFLENDKGRQSANFMNDVLQGRYGFRLKFSSRKPKNNYIHFTEPEQSQDADAAKIEGTYALRISPTEIRIFGGASGNDKAYFYAIQTLLQLLPAEFDGKAQVSAMYVYDEPRFRYRGMHLDIARHFQPVEFVKRYIDLMSQFKFNTFHWHLTDDQGWRIEIKKYPKLTEIGSKRPETVKERNLSPYIGDGIPHGGFYTQEQIRDVVKYAKERYITVIPEIELPGHASAALAAYPELGCKADYQYKVQTTWGIFKEVFCPTETTFKFLEDVLEETISLFPDSPYIHIGGDEVLKDHWKESAFVQELKQKEGLKDEHEVQSYFVQRMEKFVNSKGKKIIGWDEILDGGLAPNATLMSWRGMKGGIEAARSKHDVIMTPTDFVYFDYGQGDPAYEPLNIGSYVPLEKVYSFEPVPPELTAEEAKYVIGGQANIWTEYIKTPSHLEYMAFPRMLALSEVLWSRKEDRDFADFRRRLNAVLPRLDKQGVNYRIPEPGGLQNIVTDSERITVELMPDPGTRLHYTLDGRDPDENSPIYERPIEIELKERKTVPLKTRVVNAAGRKSAVYAMMVVGYPMREPDATDAAKPGVNFEFVVPNEVPELKGAAQLGETRSILLTQFAKNYDLKKPFIVQFDGYFKAPTDGVYELQIDSTWDATLILGETKLIDDAGTKDSRKRSVIVPLKAGLHKISLRYNHRGGDLNFRFRWGIKGKGLSQAYGGEFVH